MSRARPTTFEDDDDEMSTSSPVKQRASTEKITVADFQERLKSLNLILKDAFMLKGIVSGETFKHPSGNDQRQTSKIKEAKNGERNESYVHIKTKEGVEIALSVKLAEERIDSLLKKYDKMVSLVTRTYKPKKVKEGDEDKIKDLDKPKYLTDAGRDFLLGLAYGNGAALGFSKFQVPRSKVSKDTVEYVRTFLEMDGHNQSDYRKLSTEFRENGDKINERFKDNLAYHGVHDVDNVDDLRVEDVDINRKLKPLFDRNITTRTINTRLYHKFFAFTKLRKGNRVAMKGVVGSREYNQFHEFLRNPNGFKPILRGEDLSRKFKGKLEGETEARINARTPYDYIQNVNDGKSKEYDKKTRKTYLVDNINEDGIHSNCGMSIIAGLTIPSAFLSQEQLTELNSYQDAVIELSDYIGYVVTGYNDAKKYLDKKETVTVKKTKSESSPVKKTKKISTLSAI